MLTKYTPALTCKLTYIRTDTQTSSNIRTGSHTQRRAKSYLHTTILIYTRIHTYKWALISSSTRSQTHTQSQSHLHLHEKLHLPAFACKFPHAVTFTLPPTGAFAQYVYPHPLSRLQGMTYFIIQIHHQTNLSRLIPQPSIPTKSI